MKASLPRASVAAPKETLFTLRDFVMCSMPVLALVGSIVSML